MVPPLQTSCFTKALGVTDVNPFAWHRLQKLGHWGCSPKPPIRKPTPAPSLSSQPRQPLSYRTAAYFIVSVFLLIPIYCLFPLLAYLLTFSLLSHLTRDHSSNKLLPPGGGETAFQNLSAVSVLGRTWEQLPLAVGSKLPATSLLFLTTCWGHSDHHLLRKLRLHVMEQQPPPAHHYKK